jgi:hypothetical protein
MRRLGGVIRPGAVCLLLAAHLCGVLSAETAALTEAASGKADSGEQGKSELVAMKQEFATLMKRRAGVVEQCKDSTLRMNALRNAKLANTDSSMEEGRLLLFASSKVEAALDEQADVKALQAKWDAAQTQKVVEAKARAEALGAWRNARAKKMQVHKDAIDLANRKAEESKRALLAQAGVKTQQELPEADKAKFVEIENLWKKDVKEASDAMTRLVSRDVASRESDEEWKRFSALDAECKAIENTQRDLKGKLGALRASLKKSDQAIAALQQKVADARAAYVAAVDGSQEQVAGRRFIENAQKMRDEIDDRANTLRRAILEKDPEYKPTLDGQAKAGGLGV